MINDFRFFIFYLLYFVPSQSNINNHIISESLLRSDDLRGGITFISLTRRLDIKGSISDVVFAKLGVVFDVNTVSDKVFVAIGFSSLSRLNDLQDCIAFTSLTRRLDIKGLLSDVVFAKLIVAVEISNITKIAIKHNFFTP